MISHGKYAGTGSRREFGGGVIDRSGGSASTAGNHAESRVSRFSAGFCRGCDAGGLVFFH